MAKIGTRIEVLKDKLGKSYRQMEIESGLGNGTLASWKDQNVEFYTDKVEKFLQFYRIDRSWWRTGNGSIFDEKPTHGQISTDNNEKLDKEKILDVLKEALQEGSEYRIIPKTVLDGEYIIMSKRSLEQQARDAEQRAKEYEDRRQERQDTINSLHKVIKVYEDEISRLQTLVNMPTQKT